MKNIRKYFSAFCGLFRLGKEFIWNCGRIKIHGVKYYIGLNVKFRISSYSFVDLGPKTWIDSNSYISASGKIKIGYNNYFNTNCKLVAMERITIGNNNLFGPNVVIVDHNHQFSQPEVLICKQGFQIKGINIGSDIWIGANTVICAGVEICDHVVVGANSVVVKSIFKPGVYAGAPARYIKSLGEEK